MTKHTADDAARGIMGDRTPADFGKEFCLGFDAEGYERREQVTAVVECPKCGKEVALTAGTEAWTQEFNNGNWHHEDYGPGTGECCGVLLVHSYEGIEAYKIEVKGGE